MECEMTLQLKRILSWIDRYIHHDLIDKEELALDIWFYDPHASRSIIHSRCCSAGRAYLKEREAQECYARRVYPLNSHLSIDDAKHLIEYAQLSHHEKYMLYLRFWKDLSLSQISLELKCSVSSISRELHSILEKLKLASYSLERTDSHAFTSRS